ncbi:hypothetical protein AB4Y30_08665 [Ornithinibacillus sp. 4-3]|uniref:Lycopene cyclase domain-containing protein n=1 Tax=Ornithinibacillus sp. 4-3 TaxID=3231488 RepID=A0AB39HVD7_9BACI
MFHFKLILLSLPIIGLFLIAGTYLGLKTKNTIEVSLFATPIIVLYLFINGLLMNSSKGEMPWLAIFPNFHFHYGIVALYAKDPFLIYLIVPIIWLIGIFFLYTHWFKKQKNRFNG